MNTLIRIALPIGLAAALALPGLVAAAPGAPAVQLLNEAFQEVVVKDKDGKPVLGKDGQPVKKRQGVSSAVPGAEIIYVLTYRNTGSKPVTGVVVNNAVPVHLSYVPGSAQGAGTRVEVSVDGGKTWGTLDKLSVATAGGGTRPAQGGDVTHLRWTVLGEVPGGKDGSVTYRATVR